MASDFVSASPSGDVTHVAVPVPAGGVERVTAPRVVAAPYTPPGDRGWATAPPVDLTAHEAPPVVLAASAAAEVIDAPPPELMWLMLHEALTVVSILAQGSLRSHPELADLTIVHNVPPLDAFTRVRERQPVPENPV